MVPSRLRASCARCRARSAVLRVVGAQTSRFGGASRAPKTLNLRLVRARPGVRTRALKQPERRGARHRDGAPPQRRRGLSKLRRGLSSPSCRMRYLSAIAELRHVQSTEIIRAMMSQPETCVAGRVRCTEVFIVGSQRSGDVWTSPFGYRRLLSALDVSCPVRLVVGGHLLDVGQHLAPRAVRAALRRSAAPRAGPGPSPIDSEAAAKRRPQSRAPRAAPARRSAAPPRHRRPPRPAPARLRFPRAHRGSRRGAEAIRVAS